MVRGQDGYAGDCKSPSNPVRFRGVLPNIGDEMRLLADPNTIAAYLYLHLAEQMPEDAPDEWFLQPDPANIDVARVERFVRECTVLSELLSRSPTFTAEEYQSLFYEAAKETFDHDKKMIRTFFMWLYLVMFQTDSGPRWGEFVVAFGPERFSGLMRERFLTVLPS